MKNHLRHMTGAFACVWMLLLFCTTVMAAAPASWKADNIPLQQYAMGIMARVQQDGTTLQLPGSKIAAFLGDELRGVADFDNEDGLYFYNLIIAVADTSENGFTFKFYNPTDDTVSDLELPAGVSTVSYQALGYGRFTANGFEPFVLTLPEIVLPVVTVTASDDTASEPTSSTVAASDTGKFVFRRTTEDTSEPLTIYYTITGTAKKGKDYKALANPFTIPKGYRTQALYVTPLYDKEIEGDETVIVTIDAKPNYTVGESNTATVTIKDTTPAIINPTITYTLSPAEAVAAGAMWKIDDGEWNASGAIVTTNTGNHAISFKEVDGYTAPEGESITLVSGEEKVATATYVVIPPNPTVKFTLGPDAAVTAGAMWKIDNGEWNASDAVVEATVGDHAITFKNAMGYFTPESQEITLTVGEAMTGTATYTTIPVHPADCLTKDFVITGLEGLRYAGPVNVIALGNLEYDWDEPDVLSIRPKTEGNGEEAGDGIAITRGVSTIIYSENSLVTVTLTISGADKMSSLCIGEIIPDGWTVVGDKAANVANGVLRQYWEAPNIPDSFSYDLQAPESDLADNCTISSNAADTGCYTDKLETLTVANTKLRIFHPADCINHDGKISGLEYLTYAGPVKAAILGNYEYTWDGKDLFSIVPKNASRAGGDCDVAITRSVDRTVYAPGDEIAVTLSITGADGMVSLFIGETIPAGWTVVDANGANVSNGILRRSWDAPAIPETFTYVLKAPEMAATACLLRSNAADTGCYINGTRPIAVADTLLSTGDAYEEWPEALEFYTPVEGKRIRDAEDLAVTFSWPAVMDAEGYRLIVATYDGTIIIDETCATTACAITGLELGSYVWSVTALGDDCIAGMTQLFHFAVVENNSFPLVSEAIAEGNAVVLLFDTAEVGYRDGAFPCQILFFSMDTNDWYTENKVIQVTNGKAIIDLGMAAANGCLCLRPANSESSIELFVK